ncbi:hypothetical protein DAPPUDRAFT_248296 [Daphnia pulex]|uniref:Uncharacterized protein n=1 Tax=Daphnia pulex TaxID=6669 RepID=E9GU46_DAPPU|nr:hypothetical protein DAPPUDRAFT_248296 [Daphnia pulex]|eukprot:EFX77040.1 hypothetical protein DAPPUDRAFT_248296 [Daphnia pulex]
MAIIMGMEVVASLHRVRRLVVVTSQYGRFIDSLVKVGDRVCSTVAEIENTTNSELRGCCIINMVLLQLAGAHDLSSLAICTGVEFNRLLPSPRPDPLGWEFVTVYLKKQSTGASIKMVDESCNLEAAHLWKMLSENDVEVKCMLSNAQSLIEVLTNQTNLEAKDLETTLSTTSRSPKNLEASRFGNHAVQHIQKPINI